MITVVCALLIAAAGVTPPAVPRGHSRLLVLDFKGDAEPNLRALAQRTVTDALTARGNYDVLSTHDLASMVDLEADKQAAGCATDCVAEIAGAMGAEVVVTGEVSGGGGGFVVQLTMLRPAEARVIARGSARAPSADRIADAAKTATRLLIDGPAPWPMPVAIGGAAAAVVGGAAIVIGLVPFVMAMSSQSAAERLVVDGGDAADFADAHAAYAAAADQWASWGAPVVVIGGAVIVVGGTAAIVGAVAME